MHITRKTNKPHSMPNTLILKKFSLSKKLTQSWASALQMVNVWYFLLIMANLFDLICKKTTQIKGILYISEI